MHYLKKIKVKFNDPFKLHFLIRIRIHFSPVSANPERAADQWSGRRENNTSTSGVSFHKD
jgi:hypothetical protein